MTDLTVGKPSSVIMKFSLPLLLSTALQQLYNIANSIIVGQFTGGNGLAAIGAAYPITLFYVAIATGGAMGCAVTISQLFGSKDLARVKSAVFTTLIALSALGILISLSGIIFSGALMRLLNANEIYFADAKAYLMIYSIGVVPTMVYNGVNAIFTGLGDSRRPLLFLFLSSALNVVLALIAVRGLNLGVSGAAWATVISQTFAAVLSGTVIIRKIRALKTSEPFKYFDAPLLLDMSRIALPSIFQQSCVALAHTIVQGLVNTFDPSVVAGYEIASKFNNFIYMCMNTLGTALSSFVAQAYGARQSERIRAGYRVTLKTCLACAITIIVITQLFSAQIMGLFVDAAKEPDVIAVGVSYTRIIFPVYILISVIITTGGYLRGLGRSFVFFLETLAEFVVRVSMCFVLTDLLQSYTGLMWAWYFGSSVGCTLCIMLYFNTKKKLLSPEASLVS